MPYDKATPGLMTHLQHMHRDMDPSSEYFGSPVLVLTDFPDPQDRYVVGIQRIPACKHARRLFLYRPFQLRMRTVGLPGENIRDIMIMTRDKIQRTEEMMEVLGGTFAEILRAHARSQLVDKTYTADIHSFPLWREMTSAYFELACRIPYLRQIHLLARILGTMIPTDAIKPIMRMQNLLWWDKDTVPLHQALAEGEECRQRAEQLAYSKNADQALIAYCHAILLLYPWYPSEFYMAPWESRLNGTGGLVVKCNISIASIAITSTSDLGTAYELLDFTASLACVTNWEMTRISHLQAMIATKMKTEPQPARRHVQIKDDFFLAGVYSAPLQPKRRVTTLPRPVLLAQRDDYKTKMGSKLAHEPWIGDFSPKCYSEHYEALRSRLSAKRAGKKEPHEPWWETHFDTEAYWMRERVRSMAYRLEAHRTRPEANKTDLMEQIDDLEIANRLYDLRCQGEAELQRQISEAHRLQNLKRARAEDEGDARREITLRG